MATRQTKPSVTRAKKSDVANVKSDRTEPVAAYDWTTGTPGVFSRHAEACKIREGLACTCGPLGFRASIRGESNVRVLGPTFGTLEEATAWQEESRANPAAAEGRTTLGEVMEDYLAAVEQGALRDRRNEPYSRDGVIRLRRGLSYVAGELGSMGLQDVRRQHVQRLIDTLYDAGLASEGITELVDALDGLYGYALRNELVGFSPVVQLDLHDAEPTDHGSVTSGAFPRADLTGPMTIQSSAADPSTPTQSAQFPTVPDQRTGELSRPGTESNATEQERLLWWTLRIIVIVFVLIALVLAAESV